MMNELIPLMDTIGAVAFLFAFRFAWKSIPHAGESRAYWIILSFGMLQAFAWSLATMLESLGFNPVAFAAMKPILATALLVNLSLAAILSFVSLTRPFD
ncbi:MAG: hypothetical protein AABW68_05285 [archaeon]